MGVLVGGLAASLALLITSGIAYLLTSTLPFTMLNALVFVLVLGLLVGYQGLGAEWVAPQSLTIHWLPWRIRHVVTLPPSSWGGRAAARWPSA